MTTSTPTLALTLYDASGDASTTFSAYRAVQAGIAGTSNMYKIDTGITADRARLTLLEGTRGAILVPALYISANYYEASGIAEITSLTTNMAIILKLDTQSAGTVTLNINALGTKTISKINSAGTVVNITGGELMVNKNYLFRYDGTQWIWVGSTVADQIYIAGTSGNVVTVNTDNTLLGTTTQSLLISATGHAASAKSPPVDADEFSLFDSASSYVLKKVTLAVLKLAVYVGIKPSDGTMWNGKITPSVATNDLTLALKTFAGTDPSATDPVYITIGGTVRTITSALSVTKLDGTNWCNSGAVELGTKEIDYFVYLGYNATDGVVIGFSRISFANIYSDFSATTTNEKYCAISTITNAAAGDNYVNIGRFAATLSLTGTGFLWSVPTFTTKNLVQFPIFETRWLSFYPVFSTLTVGSATITATYQIERQNVKISVELIWAADTTGGATTDHTLPISSSATGTDRMNVGLVNLRDASPAAQYPGLVNMISTTSVRYKSQNAASTTLVTAEVTTLLPFTWTTNDLYDEVSSYITP